MQRSEDDRVQKLLHEKAPAWQSKLLSATIPLAKLALNVLNVVGPYLLQFAAAVAAVYRVLPKNVLAMLYGLALCFFGGFFALSIAAVEAFAALGGNEVHEALNHIAEDLKAVHSASKKDDDVDADGNGIKDVDELSSKELASRKFALAMRTVNPERLGSALSGVYKGYIGVLVVLKFQFARTVSLALSIGDYLRPLTAKFVAPALAVVVPSDYQKWIAPGINFMCKSIAMTIAWRIQRVISTVQSAMKGGLMFARGLLHFVKDNGYISISHEDTYIDEVLGFILAACGFYVQAYVIGWDLPWIVDVLLSPFHLIEWFLMWSVTWMDTLGTTTANVN